MNHFLDHSKEEHLYIMQSNDSTPTKANRNKNMNYSPSLHNNNDDMITTTITATLDYEDDNALEGFHHNNACIVDDTKSLFIRVPNISSMSESPPRTTSLTSPTISTIVTNSVTNNEVCNSNNDNEEEESLISALTMDYMISGGMTEPPISATNSVTPSLLSHVGNDEPIVLTSIPQDQCRYRVTQWNYKQHGFYSDMIHDGIKYMNNKHSSSLVATTEIAPNEVFEQAPIIDDNHLHNEKNVIMLFESPSCSSDTTSFYNGQGAFKFHDATVINPIHKTFLAPARYSMMNGSKYPSYMKIYTMPEDDRPDHDKPELLLMKHMEHWKKHIPHFIEPTFVSNIIDNDNEDTPIVYSYLPCEQIKNHMNDPHIHYHLCGKDAIHLMTNKTPKLYLNTRDIRPCICKTTHSMGGKGIFVIHNDVDEQEFHQYLLDHHNPPFIITEFINIRRNIACHFFIHPNQMDIILIGSNENKRNEFGEWNSDSIIEYDEQNILMNIQLSIVSDVVQYCHTLQFWGFIGIDILLDEYNKAYLVDVNPRCTGSSPAIMLFHILHSEYQYKFGLFRRISKYSYNGTSNQLLEQIDLYNKNNYGKSIIILLSFAQQTLYQTYAQIGVYNNQSIDECEKILNQFSISTQLCRIQGGENNRI